MQLPQHLRLPDWLQGNQCLSLHAFGRFQQTWRSAIFTDFFTKQQKNTTLRGDDEFSPLIKYCEGWWKLKSCWDQCMIFGGFKVKFAQKRHYEIRHFRDRPKSTHSKLSCLFCIDFSNWFYDFGCKQPSTLKQFKIDACSFQRFLHLRYKKRVCIGLSYYILCNII